MTQASPTDVLGDFRYGSGETGIIRSVHALSALFCIASMSLLVGMELPDVIKIHLSNEAECCPNGFRSALGLVKNLLRMQVVKLPSAKMFHQCLKKEKCRGP